MYGIENKNTGKLLVAMMAVLVAMAGAVVVLSDNTNAAIDDGDVASIGDTGYDTLEAAVEAASGTPETPTTIELHDDVTFSNAFANPLKYIIIEGNNHILTVDGTINVGEDVTFKDMIVKTTQTDSYLINSVSLDFASYVKLTLNNVDFVDIDGSVIYINSLGSNSEVTITDCDLGGARVVFSSATSEVGTIAFNNTANVNMQVTSDGGNKKIEAGTNITYDDKSSFDTVELSGDVELDLNKSIIPADKITVDPNSSGSIVCDDPSKITADISDVPVLNSDGDISMSGNVNFTSNTTIDENVTYTGVVTIAEGVVVTVANGVTLTFDVGSTVNLYGSIEIAPVADPGTVGFVINNGTMYVLAANASYPNDMTGTGTVDTSAVSSEAGLRGELRTDSVFTEQQIVTVDSNLTLVAGTQLIIEGTLVIPEDITVTIQEGAQLIIRGQAASVENNGTIIVNSFEEDVTVGIPSEITGYVGGLVINGGTFENNGTITAQYMRDNPETEQIPVIVSIGEDAAVTNNGTITIGAESEITLLGKLVNATEGTVSINGEISGNMKNQGTVTLNCVLVEDLTITQTAADATVQVSAISGAFVLDVLTDIEKVGNNNVAESKAGIRINAMAANQVVGGITIVAGTFSEGTPVTYYNAVTLSGTAVATTSNTTPSEDWTAYVTIYGNTFVTDELTFGAHITVNFGNTTSGALNLMVSGNMIINQYYPTVGTDSEITVTGLLQTYSDITSVSGLTVNAAKYITQPATANDRTVYNYTTLESAVASGNTTIGVYGQIDVTSDVTVPSGTTVTQYAGTSQDGKITVDEDATLTFAEGSRFNQSGTFATAADGEYPGVDVEGTLYFENARNSVSSTAKIYSEVNSTTGTDAMYTSLVNAMDAAVEDSDTVIELYNKAVSIDRTTFTIKSGVTVDTNNQNFTVNGSTLIINGTLFVNGGTYDVKDDTTTTEGYTYESTVTLNGYIKSTQEFSYNGEEYPAGAYYVIYTNGVPMYYATTVANASTTIMDVEDNTVTLYGTLNIGDVSFSGTADEQAYVIIGNGAKITAGTVTIDEARITIGTDAGAATFVGTIANADGSVQFATDTSITAGAYVEDDTTTENGTRLTLVAVTTGTSDKTGEIVIDGTVYIGTASNIYNMTVDGTAQVAANGVQAGTVTINGTLNVVANASITIGTAYVAGTLSTAVATAEAPGQGTAAVTDLYVGILMTDGKLVDGPAGTVSGNVSLTTKDGSIVGAAYVSVDSSVPEAMTELDSTGFYVDDALWMTAYGNEADVPNAPVQDAEFLGWDNPETETVESYKLGIDISAQDRLDANIKYDVYNVAIVADNSIGSVAIDGQMLVQTQYGYTLPGGAKLTAGQHTVSYTLAGGYSGSATLSSSNVQVSGMTFTLSGDYGSDEEPLYYYLSLGGAEYTGSTVVVDGGNGDDGLGLTDILLIILVVLIVIMAIIVALRMMRS